MHNAVDRKPVILSKELSIHAAIQSMTTAKKSCVLIHDENDMLCGIVTERDVLGKIANLDIDDKLTYKISTVMTKPIIFIYDTPSLLIQVRDLYNSKGFRNFPILKAQQPPRREHLVGLLTATDFFRYYINRI